MRVAYLGNYVVPYTTESHVARAFEENGCEVDRITQDEAFRVGAQAMIDRLAHADMTVYTRTHNATALGVEWSDAWRKLAAADVVTASIHLDRFWDLEREHLVTAPDPDPLFTTGYVFTADGGNQDRWKAAGINHHWMPPGVDRHEATEMPGRARPEMAHDVVFVGSASNYHTAYPQRVELVNHLRDVYGDRFAHYGHGGGRPVVRMQDLNDLYVSAKVIVGDSCFANEKGSPRSRAYFSDRIPETIGRGGFLLHPWVPGIGHLFSGRELATYAPGDWDDLDAQIGSYLAASGYREGMVEHGRDRVLREHTYTARVAEILRVVGLAEREEVRDG